MTKVIQHDVEAFHTNPLPKHYDFWDVVLVKEVLHVVLGIREDGTKEILEDLK